MSATFDLEQSMDALAVANRVRLLNAETTAGIRRADRRDGALRAAAIVLNPQGAAASIPVGRLLRSVHKVGAHKAAAWMRSAGVMFADRPLRSLTDRQRRVLADRLEEYAR